MVVRRNQVKLSKQCRNWFFSHFVWRSFSWEDLHRRSGSFSELSFGHWEAFQQLHISVLHKQTWPVRTLGCFKENTEGEGCCFLKKPACENHIVAFKPFRTGSVNFRRNLNFSWLYCQSACIPVIINIISTDSFMGAKRCSFKWFLLPSLPCYLISWNQKVTYSVNLCMLT